MYWYGGTGNWSDYTNHWSNNSGNNPASPAATAPTSTDDIRFDENSFTADGQVVTINVYGYCHNMDWTGATHTPKLKGGAGKTIGVYGSLTFISNMTLGLYATSDWVNIYLEESSEDKTVTTAGQTVEIFSIDSGNEDDSWTLSDDLNAADFTMLSDGSTFDTAGYNMNIFRSGYTGEVLLDDSVQTVYLRDSVITTGIFETYSDVVLDAGSSTINIFDGDGSFHGAGETYNLVSLTGTTNLDPTLYGVDITGTNTINMLTAVAGSGIYLSDSQTVVTFVAVGTAVSSIVIDAPAITDQQQIGANTHTLPIGQVANVVVAQKITPTHTGNLYSIWVRLKRTGSATNYAIRCSVYTDNAGVPDTLVADCITDKAATGIYTGGVTAIYLFSGVALTATTPFWILLQQIGGTLSDTNYSDAALRAADSPDPYAGGECYTKTAVGDWTSASSIEGTTYADLYFIEKGIWQHDLIKTTGKVSCDYLDISNSNATGGASWYAGANSVDTDNNDGWLFEAPPPLLQDVIGQGVVPALR